MTGQVVNLNKARKARAKAEDRARANANAARHGETKEARSLREAREAQARARLDQHRKPEA